MAFPSLPTIDDVLPGVTTQELVSVTFQIDCSVGTTAFADGQTVDLLQSIADELDTQGAVIINGPASGVRNGPIVTPDDLLESMVDHLAAVDPHPQYQTNAESAATAAAAVAGLSSTLAGTSGAGSIGILDAGAKFTGTTVEAALQEATTTAEAAAAQNALLAGYASTAAGSGAALVGYPTVAPVVAARSLLMRLRDRFHIDDFVVSGDGSTRHQAMQRAIDSGEVVDFAPLTYNLGEMVILKDNARLRGAGSWSAVSSPSWSAGNTRLLYVGTGGANSCVVRASAGAVGVDPGAAGQIENMEFTGFTIDGGGISEFGAVFVRAWSNNKLDYLTFTNTLKHGAWAANCWNGTVSNWMGYKNLGCGLTMGRDLFGWGSAPVDQSTCISFFGYYSGTNFSTVRQNQFDEVTNNEAEYGLGIYGGRGTVYINAQGSQCGGAGILLSPEIIPITLHGGYVEGNGKSSLSAKEYGLIFKGQAGGVSNNVKVSGMHFGLGDIVRLTGTQPSRIEGGFVIENTPVLSEVESDWGNYRIIDCDRNVTISGTQPNGFRGAINGTARNMDTAGICVFDASSGAISSLMREGIIASVAYTGVGQYTVTLSQTFTSARYGIKLATGDNRIVGSGTLTTSSFVINHRTTAGAATDSNARITVEVTGYYI